MSTVRGFNLFVILVTFSFCHCTAQEQGGTERYLGEVTPGDSALLFAPRLFDHPEGYHSSLVITKDHREIYFSPMSRYGEIQKMTQVNDAWVSEKVTFPSLADAGDPCLSPDNKRLYFLSFQPLSSDPVSRERIWYCDISEGVLLEPRVIDNAVYAHPTHWQFTVAGNYNLYFTSEIEGEENQDIYLSRYVDGEYEAPVKLPGEINTESKELCPYISPDEKYMVFSRSGEATDKADLFISYKVDDRWIEAERLPYPINSGGNDLCPMISPDGRFMFFISTRAGTSRIYWVKAPLSGIPGSGGHNP